jgi:predicted  nucleic acid-binding Zn-ribbon protein
MTWQTVVAVVSVLASLAAVAGFFRTKIKDAETYGRLLQRIETLENDQCKAEKKSEGYVELAQAVAVLSDRVARLVEDIAFVKKELHEIGIERRRS